MGWGSAVANAMPASSNGLVSGALPYVRPAPVVTLDVYVEPLPVVISDILAPPAAFQVAVPYASLSRYISTSVPLVSQCTPSDAVSL